MMHLVSLEMVFYCTCSVHMNDPRIAHIIIGSRSCFTGTSSSIFGVSSLYEVVTHIVMKESQHVWLYTHFCVFKTS